MLDMDALAGLQPEMQEAAKQALVTLATLGVWREQIRLDQARVLAGNNSQPVKELAKEILAFRQRTQALETLHQLGEQLKKEISR